MKNQSFSRVEGDLRPLWNKKQWERGGWQRLEPGIPQEDCILVPYTNEAKQGHELLSTRQWTPVTKYCRVGASSLFSENDRWMWEIFLGTIFTATDMFLNFLLNLSFLTKKKKKTKTFFLEKSILTVPVVYQKTKHQPWQQTTLGQISAHELLPLCSLSLQKWYNFISYLFPNYSVFVFQNILLHLAFSFYFKYFFTFLQNPP